MARADLIVSLAKAGAEKDDTLLKRTLEYMVEDERSRQHHVLADNLAQYIRTSPPTPQSPRRQRAGVGEAIFSLIYETIPHHRLDDLILPTDVVESVTEVVEEQHKRDALRAQSLEPRNRILLVGEPGNGKTSLAHGIADALMVPLFVVRYEGLIGSFLGETATKISELFNFVRSQSCVLFFDEFDTIGKERGDVHETGEIKRVVSSLLLQIDDLPSHVVIVTATNHHELLDRAVWRRFQLRLNIPRPDVAEITRWIDRFSEKIRFNLPIGHAELARHLAGTNFAEVKEFFEGILRRVVLSSEVDMPQILESRLKMFAKQKSISVKGPISDISY